MAYYLVTLVIETDPGEGSPDGWAWSDVLDTPNPVTVVACTQITDTPTHGQVDKLHETIWQAHALMPAQSDTY